MKKAGGEKRAGFFVVLDGPSGVGKSTLAPLLAERIAKAGHTTWTTTQPSGSPIGALARQGTHEYHGLTLACLIAADRYHHLETEIRPALRAGRVVVCDRNLPSSLVLQRLDSVPGEFVWNINAHADRPDLTIVLTGDAQRCQERAAHRGTYSRFHNGVAGEVDGYHRSVGELRRAGHQAVTVDVGERSPGQVADELGKLVVSRLPTVWW